MSPITTVSVMSLLSAHVIIAILSGTSVNAQSWNPKAQASLGTFLPQVYGISPTAYFYDFCYNYSTCYAFGGIGTTGNGLSQLFRSQPEDDIALVDSPSPATWFDRQLEPLAPSARSGGKMVLQIPPSGHPYGVLYGGTDTSGTILSDMYAFSASESRWFAFSVPTDPGNAAIPLTRFAMTSDTYGVIYLFFGVSSLTGLSSAVYRLMVDVEGGVMTNFVSLTSTAAAPAWPAARMGACCVAGQSTLWGSVTMCFGGYDNSKSFGDTWLFWHQNESWTMVSSVPRGQTSSIVPRLDAMATFLNGHALMYGGFTDASLTPVSDVNVYQFSFSDFSWSVFTSAASITPRRGAAAMFVAQLNTNAPPALQIVGGLNQLSLGDRWYLPLDINMQPLPNPQFYSLESSTPVPSAREFHSSAAVGPGFVVAFGKGANGPLNDVFYYLQPSDGDVSNFSTWLNVDTSNSTIIPSSRYGAAAYSRGSTIYFYGGYLNTALTLTNDLWSLTFDISSISYATFTINATWQKLYPIATIDPDADALGRAFHGMFAAHHQLYVVGGITGQNFVSRSIKVFDLVNHNWKSFTNVLPKAVAGFSMYFNGIDTAYVVGGWKLVGIGSQRTMVDHGYMIVLTSDGSVQQPLTTFALGRSVYRAYAGAAGSNMTMIVCGGATFESESATLGPLFAKQCGVIGLPPKPSSAVAVSPVNATVVWYPMQKQDNAGNPINVSTIGGTAVMLGSTYLYFGGSALRSMTPMEAVYSDALQQLNLNSSLCISTAGGNCVTCSQGTYLRLSSPEALSGQYKCTYTSPGTFTVNSWLPMPCGPGTYSKLTAAASIDTCALCPEGTFADASGSPTCQACNTDTQFCPVGTIFPRPKDANATTSNISTAVQPEPLSVGSTPPVVYVAAGGLVAVLLVLVALLGHWAYKLRQRRIAYFLNDDAVQELRAVYVANKRAHFGLDAEQLERALKQLGLRNIHPDLVIRLLAEHDEDGACHVTFTQFKELVVFLIERGMREPYPNTQQALNPGRALTSLERRVVGFSLKDLDSYDTDHSLGSEGEPVRVYKTRSGGVTRIVFNILALAAVIVLGGQFVFQNIQEIRTMVPSVNYDYPFVTSNLSIAVTAVGGVMNEQYCTQSCQATNAMMSSGIAIPDASQVCYYNASSSSCTMSVSCIQCALHMDTTATISFVFDKDVFATSLTISVTADTGIAASDSGSSLSVVSTSLFPPNQDVVFRGYPQSSASFSLLPTDYETVNNVVQQRIVNATGFHVQAGSSTIGNYEDSQGTTQFYGVPVDVRLFVENQVMVVTQNPQLTVPSFISQMLGTFPGIAGGLIALMQMFDSRLITRRHEKLREELMHSAMETDDRGIAVHDGNGSDAKSGALNDQELETRFLTPIT